MTLGAGDLLDSYRIIAPLKTGGMARLYLARREGAAGFSKPVAIKVIHPHLATERDFIERFIAEARLSASIVDPNVVHVEGLGEARGTLYIAMEYVHGLSLAELERELQYANRRLSVATAAFIASRVAAGLHAAHETTDHNGVPLGIIHRDVSPQNVLVAFSGHVKVIDFGIAKAALGAKGNTGDRSVYGKLAYMAPEQARSEELDRRADVFALGIVLWEMLTRTRLFVADNDVALLMLLNEKKIEHPRALTPEVPPALDAVVMKALARDRAERYATAGELGRALAEAVPEIRSMEPSDLGALLRGVAPEQLETKRALLARVGSAALAQPEAGPGHDPEVTTRVRLRPDEALAQLTLPVPPPPEVRAVSNEALAPDGPTERQAFAEVHAPDKEGEAAPLPHRPLRHRWIGVAAGMLLPLLAYASYRSAREPEHGAPPAAALSSAPIEIADEPPPAPAPPPEPAASAASSEAAPAASVPDVRVSPRKPPRRAPRDPRTTGSGAKPAAPSVNSETCEVIGGMELCH